MNCLDRAACRKSQKQTIVTSQSEATHIHPAMKTRSQSQRSNAAASIRTPVSNVDDETQVEMLRQRLESIASTWISALQERYGHSMDDQERVMLIFFIQQLQAVIPSNRPRVPRLLRSPPIPDIELLPEMISSFTLMYGRVLFYFHRKSAIQEQHGGAALLGNTFPTSPGRTSQNVHELALQWLGQSAFATAAACASNQGSAKAPPSRPSLTPTYNSTGRVAQCYTTNGHADDEIQQTVVDVPQKQKPTSVSPVAMMHEDAPFVDTRSTQDRHDILVARGLLVSLCHASRCTVPDHCCTMSKRCVEFRALWQHILSTQQQQKQQESSSSSEHPQVCCGQPCCIQARAALRHLIQCRRAPRGEGRLACELCEPLHTKLPRLLQETERNNQAYQVMVGGGGTDDDDDDDSASNSSMATIGVSP